ncbi:energy transducer TonB [Burkholderia metallica]|uniref:energy transducer TonB n=1 Tax=Burkholderia metallica TaxID=488729 RepID=UPI001F5B27BE|nr:energy transducer TonB [Burkholderia metallica]
MTRNPLESGSPLDSPGYRFAGTIALAGVLWGAFLVSSTRLFSGDEPAPRAPDSIQMQVVELPPSAPLTTHAESKAAPMEKTAPKPVPPRPTHALAPVRPAAAVKRFDPVSSHDTLPTQPPRASTETHTAQATLDDARPASATKADAAATQSTSAGNAQARLISQPLPELPDDLREQGYQAMAVARFHVHTDGTFDIALVKPTQNPRLNQILLETLRRWRFFPAMENGHPVESQQDVRVHFNVN